MKTLTSICLDILVNSVPVFPISLHKSREPCSYDLNEQVREDCPAESFQARKYVFMFTTAPRTDRNSEHSRVFRPVVQHWGSDSFCEPAPHKVTVGRNWAGVACPRGVLGQAFAAVEQVPVQSPLHSNMGCCQGLGPSSAAQSGCRGLERAGKE
jgi:hypothetical protein